MFIIDDILLSPIKGLLYIFKEIEKIAREEKEDTSEKLKKELLEAQMLFETDQIGEEEYSKKEKNILERINALQQKIVWSKKVGPKK